MALQRFWQNVRNAADFFAPPEVAVNSSQLDASSIERSQARPAIWLAPQSVEGFDPKDFDFLNDEERARLTRHVGRFLEIAETVSSAKPASNRQLDEATIEFRGIVEILRVDEFRDPDACRIGKRLQGALADRLPEWVHGYEIETGNDATGDPAMWIWIHLGDEVAERGTFHDDVNSVREIFSKAIFALFQERWPYLHFRFDAEVEELRAAARRS